MHSFNCRRACARNQCITQIPKLSRGAELVAAKKAGSVCTPLSCIGMTHVKHKMICPYSISIVLLSGFFNTISYKIFKHQPPRSTPFYMPLFLFTQQGGLEEPGILLHLRTEMACPTLPWAVPTECRWLRHQLCRRLGRGPCWRSNGGCTDPLCLEMCQRIHQNSLPCHACAQKSF